MIQRLSKIISTLLTIAFLLGRVSQGFAYDNLGAALVSEDMGTGRSEVQIDIAKKADPGAIADGDLLVDLLSGKLPERIPDSDEFILPQDSSFIPIRKKVLDAIEIAIQRCITALDPESRHTIEEGYKPYAQKTLANLFDLQANLAQKLYLFHIEVRGQNNYRLGFNTYLKENPDELEYVGLAIELIQRFSLEELAQYVTHECIPERGIILDEKTMRGDKRGAHRTIIEKLQEPIYEQLSVASLGNRFRKVINVMARSPLESMGYVNAPHGFLGEVLAQLDAGNKGAAMIAIRKTLTFPVNRPVDRIESNARYNLEAFLEIASLLITEKLMPDKEEEAVLGMLNKAREFASTAWCIEFTPENMGEAFTLGRDYHGMREQEKKEEMTKILTKGINKIAVSWAETRQYDKAKSVAKYIEASGDKVSTFLDIANVQIETGNEKEAKKTLTETEAIISTIDNVMFKIRNLLKAAKAWMRLDAKTKALEIFKQAESCVSQLPDEVEHFREHMEGYDKNDALSFITKALAKAGLYNEAREIIKKIPTKIFASQISDEIEKIQKEAIELKPDDIIYQATLLKHALIRFFAQHPDEKFYLGIDTGIKGRIGTDLTPIYQVIRKLNEIFPNLVTIEAEGQALANSIALETNGNYRNVAIVAKLAHLNIFEKLCGMNRQQQEVKPYITTINDNGKDFEYLPVLEAATLSIMMILNANDQAILHFYNKISRNPITTEELRAMIAKRIIQILPKINYGNKVKELRKTNELIKRIYISV